MKKELKKKVNLFLVGAPKCGTTSLYWYLNQHESIFFPERKEIHYFNFDFKNARGAKSIEEYEGYYCDVPKSVSYWGDASVMYLFSEVAIKEILSYNKHARFIVMLRNPVDLSYSFFLQLKYGLRENQATFKKAWSIQSERAKGHCIPNSMRRNEPKFLQYGEIASLGKQVKRLLNIVPKNQVKFYTIEELRSNPVQMCKDIFKFLDVEDQSHNINYKVYNENKVQKSSFLANVLINQPFPIRQVLKFAKYLSGKRSFKLRNQLLALNKRNIKKEPLDLKFRKELSEYFYKDVILLEELIDKDLTVWRKDLKIEF